jgi:hypothetical protein
MVTMHILKNLTSFAQRCHVYMKRLNVYMEKQSWHKLRLSPATDRCVAPGHGSMRGTPRWVKLFGIIALVLVLLFVISLLVGVRHGPGLHTPSGDAGGYTRAFGVAGQAEQPSWL